MIRLEKKRAAMILVCLVVVLFGAVYLQGHRVLNETERKLVGTWRIEPAGLPVDYTYTYVFREDGSMSGEILFKGAVVEEDWQGIWKIEGSDLIIKPQGMGALVAVPLRMAGYYPPLRPCPILSWTSEKILLDRGGREPSVLTWMK